MTGESCGHCDHLVAALSEAHQAARDALSAQPPRPLEAVSWMSAHLATADLLLIPAERAQVDGHRQARRTVRELVRVLRSIEQIAAGDAHATRRPLADLCRRAVELVDEHAAQELQLLDQLARQLGPPRAMALEESYLAALQHAPTRPHPHTHPDGFLRRIAFRYDALRDHVLDTMDGRRSPVPRQRRPRKEASKWSRYLLGG